MSAVRIVIVVLALLEGGWMAFDGTRALITGDYVTPKTGRYAGQLGPWARVVSGVGVEPRSTTMKSIFAVLGMVWIVAIVGFAMGMGWARVMMILCAAASLWYLPWGTIASIVQIILLLRMRT